jgi:tetratricopeptide (TPR) repeat protein
MFADGQSSHDRFDDYYGKAGKSKETVQRLLSIRNSVPMIVYRVNKLFGFLALGTILIILSYFSTGYGQQQKGDYFTADQDPGTKRYFQIIELNHTNRVMEWISKGRINDAINECKYTLDRIPNHPKGLMLMGVVSRLNKTPSMAISYFERAIGLFPQYALTHAQYGEYLVDIGRVEEGIAKLRKAIEIDPELALAYEWLSKAYTKIGNLEMAREAAGKAKEVSSKTGQ